MKDDNFLTKQHKINYDMYKEMYEGWGWKFITERIYHFSDGSERCRIFIVEAPPLEPREVRGGDNIKIITPFNIAEDGTVLDFGTANMSQAMDILSNIGEEEVFAMIKIESEFEIVNDKRHELFSKCMRTS